jgi:outer membrane protein
VLYKKRVFISGLLALTLAAGCIYPGTAAAQEKENSGYQIRVVDMQVILAEYDKRKEKYADLQQEVEALQKDIDAMSDRIEANKKKYDEGAGLTEEERSDLETQIKSDYAEYQSELKKRQLKIDSMEERVLKEVVKDIESAITRIAEKEGYHLILNARNGARSSVLYHSQTIDITSKVLLDLNGE